MKNHRRILLTTLLTLGILMSEQSIFAENEVAELDKRIQAIDQRAPQRKPSDETLDDISKETGVPRRKLEEQQARQKVGTGSLFIGNALAKETGKSFDEIIALHKQGQGWGKIANDHNVKLGPIVSNARKLEKQQRERVGSNKDGIKSHGKPEQAHSSGPQKGTSANVDKKPHPKKNKPPGGSKK